MTGLQLFTFLFDWLPRGKARKLNPITQMFAPYGRIVVLHITLIAGVLLVAALGQPIWAIVVLAVVKTLFDLGALGFHLEDAVRDDKTNPAFAEAEAALKIKLAAKS